MANHYVDTYQIARLGQRLQGVVLLKDCQRLVEGLPDQVNSQAVWTLVGETDARGRSYLHLHVVAEPILTCQRCLGDLPWPVDAETRLELVHTETELERLDAQDEAAGIVTDRIVGSERLDILALIEDEIILGLPYVPRHESCGASADEDTTSDAEVPQRPSPFAALGRLKKD